MRFSPGDGRGQGTGRDGAALPPAGPRSRRWMGRGPGVRLSRGRKLMSSTVLCSRWRAGTPVTSITRPSRPLRRTHQRAKTKQKNKNNKRNKSNKKAEKTEKAEKAEKTKPKASRTIATARVIAPGGAVHAASAAPIPSQSHDNATTGRRLLGAASVVTFRTAHAPVLKKDSGVDVWPRWGQASVTKQCRLDRYGTMAGSKRALRATSPADEQDEPEPRAAEHALTRVDSPPTPTLLLRLPQTHSVPPSPANLSTQRSERLPRRANRGPRARPRPPVIGRAWEIHERPRHAVVQRSTKQEYMEK